MSYVGRLEQSNINGEDFLDNSECKTATLRQLRPFEPTDNRYKATIYDIFRKKDLIRTVIYNKPMNKLDFFLFRLSEIGFCKIKSTDLNICYNLKKDRYGKFDRYKVETFEELCKKNIV